jgi:hypothetical protein
MTYRELAEVINNKLTEEQKDSDVTIYDLTTDEYYPMSDWFKSSDKFQSVLDDGHPVIEITT